MQKVLIVLTLLLITAVPAFAKNNSSENKSNNSQKEFGQSHSPKNEEENEDENEIEVSPSPEIEDDNDQDEVLTTPIPQNQCDPGKEWKNHGEYVSCVAKSGVGGQKVSEAARSKIGKKGYIPSITPSVSPSVSPSTTPSISPTTTPDPNASPSPTIDPTITPTQEETANSLLLDVINVLESLRKFLETFNPFE